MSHHAPLRTPADESAPVESPSRRRPWQLAFALLAATALCGLVAHARPNADPANGTRTAGAGLATTPITTADGPVRFTARLDREAVMDRGDGTVLVELSLHGEDVSAVTPVRTPTDLVVLLDRSGSMEGSAIAHARASTQALLERLGRLDRFALVTYSNGARLDIPLELARGDAQQRWSRQVAAIAAGGGTDMASGLDLAHRLIARSRESGRSARLILISDGHANQGDATPEGLRHRAVRAIATEYVLSTVGVGDGFDERLMTSLADAGTGNFYYVDDVTRLSHVFSDELLSARETVAQAVTIELAPSPGVSVVETAGYPVESAGNRIVLRPGPLYAGQERRIWLTLAIDEDRRRRADETIALGEFGVAFQTRAGTAHRVGLEEMPAVRVVHDQTEFAAARDAAAYVEQLRSEGLGSLRAKVARSVAAGDAAQASQYIEEFEAGNAAQLRSLGYEKPEEEVAIAAALELKDEVAEALAPSAPAAAKSRLGKKLSQQAVDGRRQGAKRPTNEPNDG
jgi:Ca-activated chloride channel family protein